MLIEHSDELLELIGHEQPAKTSTVGFLNLDEGMTAVKMRQEKISDGGNGDRRGEIERILQIDESPASLMNWKGLDRTNPGL